MKKIILHKVFCFILSFLILLFILNIILSYRELNKLKAINNPLKYYPSYLELSDVIKNQNRNNNKTIENHKELMKCLLSVDNDITNILNSNNILISLNDDEINIEYKFNNTLTNQVIGKLIGFKLDLEKNQSDYINIATFKNYIEFHDTIIFENNKYIYKYKNITDSINKVTKTEITKFTKLNKNYYTKWVDVSMKYDKKRKLYTHKASNELNYKQEEYIYLLKDRIHEYLINNTINYISIKIQIPYYSPIPPPGQSY